MTLDYSAPEALKGCFAKQSDYYAFGITLYELYKGYTPFNSLQCTEEDRIILASVQEIPFDNSFPERLKELILGLTYHVLQYRNNHENPNRRWTADEVEKWLNKVPQPLPGEIPSAAKTQTTDANVFSFQKPYNLEGGRFITNLEELVDALGQKWDLGKRHAGRGLLSKFFIDAGLQDCADKCIDFEESKGNDLNYIKLLLDIQSGLKKKHFYWQNKKYDSLSDKIIELVDNFYQKSEESKDKFLSEFKDFLHVIEYWYDDNEDEEEKKEAIEKISILQHINKDKNIEIADFFLICSIVTNKLSIKLGETKFDNKEEFIEFIEKAISSKENSEKVLTLIINNISDLYHYKKVGNLIKNLNSKIKKIDKSVVHKIIDNKSFKKNEQIEFILKTYGILVIQNENREKTYRYYKERFKTEIETVYVKINDPLIFAGNEELTEISFELLFASGVTSLRCLFQGCSNLRRISNLNLSSIQDSSSLFKDCKSLEDIPKLDTQNLICADSMFCRCSKITRIDNLNLSNLVNAKGMFQGCKGLSKIEFKNCDNLVDASLMFKECSNLAETPAMNSINCTNMKSMFMFCSSLTIPPEYNTTNNSDFSNMFAFCNNLKSMPKFNYSNATDVSHMFEGCSSISKYSPINIDNKCVKSNDIFKQCQNQISELHRYINIGNSDKSFSINQDNNNLILHCNNEQSEFDYTVITTIANYFKTTKIIIKSNSAVKLFNAIFKQEKFINFAIILDPSVTSTDEMFLDFKNLIGAPNFNTSNIKSMKSMFENCTNLRSLPSYNTSNVKFMDKIFCNCLKLETIPQFNTQNVISADKAYYNCTHLKLAPSFPLFANGTLIYDTHSKSLKNYNYYTTNIIRFIIPTILTITKSVFNIISNIIKYILTQEYNFTLIFKLTFYGILCSCITLILYNTEKILIGILIFHLLAVICILMIHPVRWFLPFANNLTLFFNFLLAMLKIKSLEYYH